MNAGENQRMPNQNQAFRISIAQVVKLVDTLASGASTRKGVEVQVLSWAPNTETSTDSSRGFLLGGH